MIDTIRANAEMVNPIILVADDQVVLKDPEGQACNRAGQKAPPAATQGSNLSLCRIRSCKDGKNRMLEFNKKMDSMLKRNFEALKTHVKKLDIQVVQTVEFVREFSL
ncbi:hypothetical protein YC2023_088883 [Brassica napus]